MLIFLTLGHQPVTVLELKLEVFFVARSLTGGFNSGTTGDQVPTEFIPFWSLVAALRGVSWWLWFTVQMRTELRLDVDLRYTTGRWTTIVQ